MDKQEGIKSRRCSSRFKQRVKLIIKPVPQKPKNREKFLKIYANLPLGVREEIVCIVDEKPITWNAAYLEVKANTKIGTEILEQLTNLEII